MKMKKVLTLGMAVAMGASALLAGCGNNSSDATPAAGSAATESGSDAAAAPSGAITVVSREDGSGTRGAFVELTGVETKDADGNKVDNTITSAEITNSTAVMMTTVAGNDSAIGYISLGSLDDSVKALNIDGVTPSMDTVKDGSYKVARPFNIAYKSDLNELGQDFIKFVMSEEGQAVVTEDGYVSQASEGTYTASNLTGDLTIGGSSSVTPVMEKLAEAYKALNSGANVTVQQSDSTTGMSSTVDGVYDIGMASRELKDTETGAGLTAKVIAMDGIAIVVNKNNAITDLTSDQVRQIYTGEVTDWSAVVK